jgi:hypothetical protein
MHNRGVMAPLARPRGGRDRSPVRSWQSSAPYDWALSKGYLVLASSAIVEQFLATFRDFPPRQKAASFTIDQALAKMAEAGSSAHR